MIICAWAIFFYDISMSKKFTDFLEYFLSMYRINCAGVKLKISMKFEIYSLPEVKVVNVVFF